MPSKSTIDHYVCTKTLGAGISGKVKLATDSNTGKKVALKIFDKSDPQKSYDALSTSINETFVLKVLKHPHIVRFIEFKEDAIFHKSKGAPIKVAYMALELITGGTLFDYISLESFDDKICRFYFKQMLQTIHFSHSMGVTHRDLKPENIMLDDQFNIRIADFGFAAPVEGKTCEGFLLTKLGTKNYMAPELLTPKPYKGHVVDLFALGIVLFILYTGQPPFTIADP